MNTRAVGWLVGCTWLLLAAFLLVPAALGLAFGERDATVACALTALGASAVGSLLVWRNRGSVLTREGQLDYFRREGLAAVGLTWLSACVVGAVPFWATGVAGPVDALFESTSGFTTTGASVLSGDGIDGMPRAIAFWRSFTHWLGGIGIVLVFVVLFPTGGRSLYRSEVPGVAREASHHRVRDSALALVRVYVGLSAALFGLLLLFGMDWFDASVHTFGTVATGGFSNHSQSVAYFGSVAIEAVLIAFMFASGINFALYDTALRQGLGQGWRRLRDSTEVRVYALSLLGGTLAITTCLWLWGGSNGDPASTLPDYRSLGLALRDSAFSATTMQSCTGYGTADFDRWPEVARVLLILLAAVGACAGSTGGGIKVVRAVIVARAALRGVRHFSRPRAIHPVVIDGRPLEEGAVASITGYFALWTLTVALGVLALTALGVDPTSAVGGVIATLNNVGPGLGEFGPAGSYGGLPEAGKLLLSVYMILGRLEFYALAALVVPGFWRR